MKITTLGARASALVSPSPIFNFSTPTAKSKPKRLLDSNQRNGLRFLYGINENNIKQASFAELVKVYQRQSNFHSRHWQDFAAAHQLSKNLRQAPTKGLHSFLATHGCQVPTTSIHYAPWVFTPTCPLRSFPGPPEPTTFGRSYSFTAITSKYPTSTHANLLIYGIFSDQLLHSIIDDESSTEVSVEPKDQNGYYSYHSD